MLSVVTPLKRSLQCRLLATVLSLGILLLQNVQHNLLPGINWKSGQHKSKLNTWWFVQASTKLLLHNAFPAEFTARLSGIITQTHKIQTYFRVAPSYCPAMPTRRPISDPTITIVCYSFGIISLLTSSCCLVFARKLQPLGTRKTAYLRPPPLQSERVCECCVGGWKIENNDVLKLLISASTMWISILPSVENIN